MDILRQVISDIKEQDAEKNDADCPSKAQLYQALIDGDRRQDVARHIEHCSRCYSKLVSFDDKEWLWEQAVEHNPEKAVTLLLGEDGCNAVRSLLQEKSGIEEILSTVKSEVVAFVSSLWQPMFAGEAVTAADLVTQSHRFEMDFGEYVVLDCNWQEKGEESWMELAWEANIFQKSMLRVRFVHPENKAVLVDIPLGTDLCGQKHLAGKELPFHPAVDKWAVAVVVEVL